MKKIEKKRKKGFTLVELIVVIAILGILAAVAVPRLSGYTTTAKQKADEATIQNIKTAAYTAIAAGEITLPTSEDKTLTIGTCVKSGTGKTDSVIDVNYFQGSTVPTKQSGGTFTIKVNSNGDVTVN